MSIRALTPAFVATVSAMASSFACNPPSIRSAGPTQPPRNVSAPASSAAANAPANTTASPKTGAAPLASTSPRPRVSREFLNPRDAQGRQILKDYQGAGCHVYLPFPPLKPGEQRVYGSAPPREAAVCPQVMLGKAFESCRDGTLRARGKSCLCTQYGNPPRQFVSPCPTAP